MWISEFIPFLFLIQLILMLSLLNKFLGFLVFIEINLILNILFFSYKSKYLQNKYIVLFMLLLASVGASIGLCLLVYNARCQNLNFKSLWSIKWVGY